MSKESRARTIDLVFPPADRLQDRVIIQCLYNFRHDTLNKIYRIYRYISNNYCHSPRINKQDVYSVK